MPRHHSLQNFFLTSSLITIQTLVVVFHTACVYAHGKGPNFLARWGPPLEMRGVDDPCAALNVTLVTELNPSSLSNLRLL